MHGVAAYYKGKFPSAQNCVIPLCESCPLARARKRTPNVKRTRDLPESEGALSHDKYEVGDFVSTDQFICRTPGQLPEGYGRESTDCCFLGGTIYNNAASGLIWVENQVSLGANETVMGKSYFEQWLWDMVYMEVKHYHGNNGISLLRNIVLSVKRKGKVSPSLGLERNAKILEPSLLFRQSCSWLVVLWCMPPCIGQIEGRMTSHCGLLQSNMWCGSIIES
jgi:hypothetical protein